MRADQKTWRRLNLSSQTCWNLFAQISLYLFSVYSELFHATPTGINFDTYDDIPVEASGEGVPNFITTVSHSFHPSIAMFGDAGDFE